MSKSYRTRHVETGIIRPKTTSAQYYQYTPVIMCPVGMWFVLLNQHHLELKACSQKRGNVANVRSSRQGAKKLQFLNDIIKSRYGFKTAQKFHKFRVLIKTLNL